MEQRIYRLPAHHFRAAEYHANRFRIKTRTGDPFDAVKDKSYWAHVSSKTKAGDIIEALDADMLWYAEFLVMDSGDGWVKTKVINFHDLSDEAPKVDDGYKLKFIPGGSKRWTVVRNADGITIKDTLESKESAAAWLEEFLKTQ